MRARGRIRGIYLLGMRIEASRNSPVYFVSALP